MRNISDTYGFPNKYSLAPRICNFVILLSFMTAENSSTGKGAIFFKLRLLTSHSILEPKFVGSPLAANGKQRYEQGLQCFLQKIILNHLAKNCIQTATSWARRPVSLPPCLRPPSLLTQKLIQVMLGPKPASAGRLSVRCGKLQ